MLLVRRSVTGRLPSLALLPQSPYVCVEYVPVAEISPFVLDVILSHLRFIEETVAVVIMAAKIVLVV